ncbi:hypothetical protein [Lysobacter gummosus]|uniref:hypothetical protein n=1 Tax=Lysobacter gummosus TaxID=262324 RepID=UPI003637BE52
MVRCSPALRAGLDARGRLMRGVSLHVTLATASIRDSGRMGRACLPQPGRGPHGRGPIAVPGWGAGGFGPGGPAAAAPTAKPRRRRRARLRPAILARKHGLEPRPAHTIQPLGRTV